MQKSGIMKFRNFIIAIIIPTLTLFTSCNDYLNIENKGQVDSENISKSINNLELILAGVYANAASVKFQRSLYKFGEATADNMYLINIDPTNDDMQFCTFRYTPDNSVLEDMWSSCYEGVNRANRALENIEIAYWPWYDFVISKDQTQSSLYDTHASQFQHMAGEAKFWRAFYYFYLVRSFGDVPIQNEIQYIDGSGNNFITPRSPVLEVYDYIEKDLREAILTCRKYVNIIDPEVEKDAGRITRGAATSLLIKVLAYRASIDEVNSKALWQEVLDLTNWMSDQPTNSIEYTNAQILKNIYNGITWDSISSILYIDRSHNINKADDQLTAPADYSLLPYYDMLFRVESEFCCESILEINHNYSGTGLKDNQNVGSSIWDELSSYEPSANFQAGGSKYMKPSLHLANYKQNLVVKDPRFSFCLPPNQAKIKTGLEFGNEPSTTPGNCHSGKYYVWTDYIPSNGVLNDNARNVVLLRYAEVLLWQAEALNELGRGNEAVAIINRIRDRASISKGIIGNLSGKYISATTSYPNSGKPFPDRLLYLQAETNTEFLPEVEVRDYYYIRQAIWNERDAELCHEFDRFYDLVRTKQIYEALDNYNSHETYSQFRMKLFVKDKHEIFAIPQDEINKSNGLWSQNPGY